MRLVAHTDGGGGVGGREAYIGVVITDPDTGETLLEHGAAIGSVTHNEAEYSALLFALHQAIEWNAEELVVRSDSKLVVNQVSGLWQIRENHLRERADEAKRLIGLLPAFSLEWVPRAENAHANRLTWVERPEAGRR